MCSDRNFDRTEQKFKLETCRLTRSNFGTICKQKEETKPDSLLHIIMDYDDGLTQQLHNGTETTK